MTQAQFNRMMLQIRQTHIRMGAVLEDAAKLGVDNIDAFRRHGATFHTLKAEQERALSDIRNSLTEHWQKNAGSKFHRHGVDIVVKPQEGRTSALRRIHQ